MTARSSCLSGMLHSSVETFDDDLSLRVLTGDLQAQALRVIEVHGFGHVHLDSTSGVNPDHARLVWELGIVQAHRCGIRCGAEAEDLHQRVLQLIADELKWRPLVAGN